MPTSRWNICTIKFILHIIFIEYCANADFGLKSNSLNFLRIVFNLGRFISNSFYFATMLYSNRHYFKWEGCYWHCQHSHHKCIQNWAWFNVQRNLPSTRKLFAENDTKEPKANLTYPFTHTNEFFFASHAQRITTELCFYFISIGSILEMFLCERKLMKIWRNEHSAGR